MAGVIDEKYNLAVKFPDVAAQWHPTKNGELTQYDVTPGSNKKVWWICEIEHEWEAMVSSRTKGAGCPYCANRRIWNTGDKRDNHLVATHPELIKEWHPTRNGELTPEDVTSGASKRVIWKCEKCGNEWQTAMKNRTGRNTSCPSCARLRASERYNLAVEFPEIAAQWHPTKNGELTQYDVTPKSNKKIWWKGECGHEWDARIAHITAGGGCPYCAGRSPVMQGVPLDIDADDYEIEHSQMEMIRDLQQEVAELRNLIQTMAREGRKG